MFFNGNHRYWYKLLNNQEKQFLYSNPLKSKFLPLSEVKLALNYNQLKEQGHPVLQVIKNLTHKRKDWGILIMLIFKIFEESHPTQPQVTQHLYQKAKKLANITEYIEVSYRFHSGLLYKENKCDWIKTTPGNKIAILSGSWTLSRAHYLLAELGNPFVLQLMSMALRDLSEGEFFGLRDTSNNPLPSRFDNCLNQISEEAPHLSVESDAVKNWNQRSVLCGATLLAYACKGSVLLIDDGAFEQELEKNAYQFGEHFALASKAYSEYLHFSRPLNDSALSMFDLTSAPILLHLESNPSLYAEIENYIDNPQNIDFFKIHNEVLNGPGLKLTKQLIKHHTENAKHHLKAFPKTKARASLFNIVSSMEPVS